MHRGFDGRGDAPRQPGRGSTSGFDTLRAQEMERLQRDIQLLQRDIANVHRDIAPHEDRIRALEEQNEAMQRAGEMGQRRIQAAHNTITRIENGTLDYGYRRNATEIEQRQALIGRETDQAQYRLDQQNAIRQEVRSIADRIEPLMIRLQDGYRRLQDLERRQANMETQMRH